MSSNLDTGAPVQQNPGAAGGANTAGAPGVATTRQRKRIPMSVARRKLEVVREIPGYHLHWFRDDKIPQAIDAFYEFVNKNEIELNSNNPGSKAAVDGNTDLGSQVSIVAGTNEQGHPARLTLMKIKEEYFEEDQNALDAANVQRMRAIFDEEQILTREGRLVNHDATVYVKTALFNRPVRKAKTVRRKRS